VRPVLSGCGLLGRIQFRKLVGGHPETLAIGLGQFVTPRPEAAKPHSPDELKRAAGMTGKPDRHDRADVTIDLGPQDAFIEAPKRLDEQA
jgi:hypothetical protein